MWAKKAWYMNKQIFLRERVKRKIMPIPNYSTLAWYLNSEMVHPKYMQFKTFRDWNKCQVATPALWKRTGWDFLKFSADLEHAETVKV